jgi:outer membrane usher protein
MPSRRFFALIIAAASGIATAAPDPDPEREALLEVTVNGDKQSTWTLIQLTPEGVPWVHKSDLVAWGVQFGEDSSMTLLADDAFIALDAVPGVSATVDRAGSRLDVVVQPALLHGHEFRTTRPEPKAVSSPPAAFVNYDLDVFGGAGTPVLRAATELGVVYGNWVARSTWLGVSQAGQTSKLRIDSNVTADYPATRTSLQWGDTFARLGNNLEAVRIGGISFGTDFSVTPTFVTVPLPTISNLVANQGSVDLYVNGNKTQQLNVPGGPFSVAQVPVTTGAGELTVVTHDLLGRTQTYTQSYYISPQMLAAGLSAWDMQFGSKRLAYGVSSDQYTGWLASGGERYGLNGSTTAQWRVEADETGEAVSAQLLALAAHNSLFTLSGYCSAIHADIGCLAEAAIEHDRPAFGYGLDITVATTRYQPVAAAQRALPIRWQVFPHVQADVGAGFSLLAAAAWREEHAGDHTVSLNLAAGKTIRGAGHIDLLVSRLQGSLHSTLVNLIYTQGIGRDMSASASTYSNDGQVGNALSIARNLPAGEGYGYSLRAARDQVTSLQAGGQWNGDAMTAAAAVQRDGTHNAYSADISGAVVWFSGGVLPARHLNQGFAIVDAPGLANQPVFLNQQPVTRTNSAGLAVLADVRPFQINKIALDPQSLPLTLDVERTYFDVVPYRRGGAIVDVQTRLGASIRLMQQDGQPVPIGARVFQQGHSAPVGMDGMAYVDGTSGDNALRVEWGQGSCATHLKLPATQDTVVLTCVAR